MTVFLQRGEECYRWEVARVLGRPPNLAPPRWALVESLWHFLGPVPEPTPEATVTPEDWVAQLVAAVRPGSKGASLCLIVPDHTRKGPWSLLLPALLEGLAAIGEFGELRLLVATGTHASVPARQAQRCLEGLSAEARSAWTLLQNSEDGFVDHRFVAETSAGTPVSLHSSYLDADVRIVFGEVSYHYFAGFGGGPKLIFPGAAEPRGAGLNHRRALLSTRGADGGSDRPATTGAPAGDGGLSWNPRCGTGQLQDNPVHLDLLEASLLEPPTWVVTVVPVPVLDADPSRPLPPRVEVVQGRFPDSYFSAIDRYDGCHRLEFTQRPDLLLIDAGGTPRDDTFLQAHKSLQAARPFVRGGGRILLVAACGQGWGSAELAARASQGGGSRHDDDTLHAQTWAALSDLLSQCQVGLWSELPPGEVTALGMVPLASESEARSWMGREGRWGWLPRAERFRPAEGWLGGDGQN